MNIIQYNLLIYVKYFIHGYKLNKHYGLQDLQVRII